MSDINDIDLLTNLTDREIIKPLVSAEDNYIQNRAILVELEAEENRFKIAFGLSGFLTALPTSSVIASWLALPGMAAVGFTAEYITRVKRIYSITNMLLDYFGDDGIKITLRAKTNSTVIDLFVRMPDRRIFAVMVRANANTAIRWREDRQEFLVAKKGKNWKKSEPLTRTLEKLGAVMDLKKGKSPLMGTSSGERNAPLIKAIVLGQGARISPGNSPELWADFGRTRTLKIRTSSTTYVVEQDNSIDFLLLPAPNVQILRDPGNNVK